MSPYAAAALKDGTDGIVVAQPDQDAVNFVEAVRQANPNIKIAMFPTSIGDVNKALGKTAEGIIEISSDTIALKTTAERQYEKDMKAAGYSNLTGWRLNSYASVLVFQTDRGALAENHGSDRLQCSPARQEHPDWSHPATAVRERRRRGTAEGVQPVPR